MPEFPAELESPTVSEDVLAVGRLFLTLEFDAFATADRFSLSFYAESPAVIYDPTSNGRVCDAKSSLSDT